jgi:hypothetical protein
MCASCFGKYFFSSSRYLFRYMVLAGECCDGRLGGL